MALIRITKQKMEHTIKIAPGAPPVTEVLEPIPQVCLVCANSGDVPTSQQIFARIFAGK